MKQRINLFSNDLLPPKEYFNVKSLIFAHVSLVFLGVVVALYGFVSGKNYQEDIAAIDVEINKKKQENQEYKKSLTTKQKADTLTPQIDLLKQQIASEQSLGIYIQTHKQKENLLFSPLFFALSEANQPNIWLTRIQADAAHIRIEGHVGSPQDLPFWIERLKEQDIFIGRTFSKVEMKRAENHAFLDFVLNSFSGEKP